jgi:rubrerythrin
MNAAMEVRSTEVGAPRTLAEFMALAVAMETEAAQRYAELADAMEMANNVEVAELFRRMENIERGHARKLAADMGWRDAPHAAAPGAEGAETPAMEDVHYLMQPYHALAIALDCEEHAQRFYANLAHDAVDDAVREAARTLEEEERGHVALVRAWMAKVDKPSDNWSDDPDPPRYTD